MGTPASEPLRLLLVDDHAVMRAGLSNMLDTRPEFEVVGEADDGESTLSLRQTHAPDVTLLDVVMPGMGGLDCLARLKDQCPTAKVLMLSSSEMEQDMHPTMTTGADGYLTKNAQPSELVPSILAVGKGERVVSGEVSRRLQACPESIQLTPPELEVPQLLRNGMSNPDIGDSLGNIPRTAKAHVAAILVELDARDRAEAVARGFERGLLHP